MNLNSWRHTTWGEVATLEYGKSLRQYDDRNGKYRVYGTNGPIGWHDTALYNDAGVIIGRKGAYRGVHYSPQPFFVIDTAFYLKPKQEIDPRWAYYQLLTQDINSMDSGSAIPSTSRSDFYSLPVCLPPLAEQKAISAVLGALDDKIELNRRMNATLEAMARALFQSWFVDFDPVRAKLDGHQPTGLDLATATLFPNEFEDSELGPISKRWSVGKVSDSFNLTMGQSPPGETYNETGNGIPFYQGRVDFGFRFPTRRVFCTAPTRHAKAGDTLVSVRAPVGDINMANEECCIGRGVAAVRHKSGASSFTYYAMENFESDFARFEAEGTVFGSINKQNFADLPFVTPPAELVAVYERIASPVDAEIRIFEHQSLTLAALRDTLLPKLLSGEVRTTYFM
jgi:type I restriction enzyme S subunit